MVSQNIYIITCVIWFAMKYMENFNQLSCRAVVHETQESSDVRGYRGWLLTL